MRLLKINYLWAIKNGIISSFRSLTINTYQSNHDKIYALKYKFDTAWFYIEIYDILLHYRNYFDNILILL